MADAPAAPAVPTTSTAPASPSGGVAPATSADAPEAGGGVPETPPAPVLRKLKVYGQEREVPDDVYQRYAQQGAAFAQRQQEIAEKEAAHEAKVRKWEEEIKTRTAEALKERGLDPDAWAAERLIAEHQRKQETPEQKELREAREKLATFEKEKAEAAEKARLDEIAQHRARYERDIGQKFEAALVEAGIPKGPAGWGFLEKMAGYQKELLQLAEQVEAKRITPEEYELAQAQLTPAVLSKMAIEDARNEDVVKWGKFRGKDLAAVMGPDLLARAAEAWAMVEEEKRADQGGAGAVPTGVQRPPHQNNGNGQERNGQGQFQAPVSREATFFEMATGIRRR